MAIKILKRIAILIVLLLALVCYLVFSYDNYKNKSVPILMYHGVGTEDVKDWGDLLIPPHVFEEQIKYLVDHGYKIVSVEEASKLLKMHEDVEKYIAITFDDGYVNNYIHAFPILKKYSATATFYVICDKINSAGYMNISQLKEMLDAGMKIGSHTVTHSNLTLIDEGLCQKELADSRRILEQDLQKEIESISYPNGAYNDTVVNHAIKSGYLEGVSGDFGVNTKETYEKNPMALYRIGVFNTDDGVAGLSSIIKDGYIVGFLSKYGINPELVKKFLNI